MESLKYFSTFTGIGGFELGIADRGECVGYSEIDKWAIKIYEHHFPKHKNYGDITKITADALPDFDLLCGGFPCQAFSIAGKRGGFDDTRGTLFFDLARIARAKRPRLLLFENVKGLLSHDGGRTFDTIVRAIDELGYDCQWQVLNSKDHGVPQNRERIIIVGHLRGTRRPQVFPFRQTDQIYNAGAESEKEVDNVASTLTARQFANWGGNFVRENPVAPTLRASDGKGGDNTTVVAIEDFYPDRIRTSATAPTLRSGRAGVKVGTLRTHKDGRGFRKTQSGLAPTIPARAREDGSGQGIVAIPVLTPQRMEKRQNGRRFKKDGEPAFTLNTQDQHGVYDGMAVRRLTPVECERLQGFPDRWTEIVADTHRYKTLGNAVTVNVIRDVITKII